MSGLVAVAIPLRGRLVGVMSTTGKLESVMSYLSRIDEVTWSAGKPAEKWTGNFVAEETLRQDNPSSADEAMLQWGRPVADCPASCELWMKRCSCASGCFAAPVAAAAVVDVVAEENNVVDAIVHLLVLSWPSRTCQKQSVRVA